MARRGVYEFGGMYSRMKYVGYHCRSKGLCLRSPARRLARPLASATVGAIFFYRMGDYQIAPKPPGGGFGWWRLMPPGKLKVRLREQGSFVLLHEYLSFFAKRKVPKKTTQTYGLRIPWRAMGHAKLAVLISRNWYGGGRCRFGGLLVPPAPLPLTAARVGVGALVEWRLSNRAHCGAKHRNG